MLPSSQRTPSQLPTVQLPELLDAPWQFDADGGQFAVGNFLPDRLTRVLCYVDNAAPAGETVTFNLAAGATTHSLKVYHISPPLPLPHTTEKHPVR